MLAKGMANCTRLFLFVLLVNGFGAACGPEFEPGYRIQNERILAIRADPPEAVPGQPVTFTPLVVSGSGTLGAPADYQSTWWRCDDAASDGLSDPTICTSSSARQTLSTDPTWVDVIPSDFFPAPDPSAGVPSEKLLGAVLGYWRVVGLTMQKETRIVDAVKRVVVYAPVPLGSIDARLADLDVRVDENGALAPNRNPLMTGVEIRESDVNGPAVTSVKPGETYWFKPRYDERELAAYWSLKVDLSGLDLDDPTSLSELDDDELLSRFSRVRRCEIPVFSWYVTAGALRRETTVDERVLSEVFAPMGETCPAIEGEVRRPEVRFTAPDEADLPADGLIRGWVVLRDGRGGTDWRSFEVTISR